MTRFYLTFNILHFMNGNNLFVMSWNTKIKSNTKVAPNLKLQLYFLRSYLCWSLKLFISLLYWINSNLSCLLLFANINLFMEITNWVAAPAPAQPYPCFLSQGHQQPLLYPSRLPTEIRPPKWESPSLQFLKNGSVWIRHLSSISCEPQ